jgi:hypothetical protein
VKQPDRFEWAAHAEAIVADIFGTSNISRPPDDDTWYDFEHSVGATKELIRVRKKFTDAAFVYTKARHQNSANETTPRSNGNTNSGQPYQLEAEAVFYCPDFDVVRCVLKQGDSYVVNGHGTPICILKVSGLLEEDDDDGWQAANDNAEEFARIIEANPDSFYALDEVLRKAARNGGDPGAIAPAQEDDAPAAGEQSDGQPTQDKIMAGEFLACLDPTATRFTFQTFDDNKVRKNPALARVLHGTLDECFPELIRLNNLGAGVFVTISETDFQGRSTKNIVRARALFSDADCEEQIARSQAIIEACDAEPSMAVSSGGGGHGHWYFICIDIPLDQFSTLQKALAAKLGTDPAVHDLPRVMRLPGTLHMKDPTKPRLVKLFPTNGAVKIWKLADLINKLGLDAAQPADRPGDPGLGDPDDLAAGIIYDKSLLPFAPIKAGCGWLREVHDTGGKDESEVLWRDALRCCYFLIDGDKLIHELSDKYDGYSREATEKKFDEAKRATESKNLGWPLCKTIRDHGCKHCEKCPHFANGGSPLHLAPRQALDAGVKLEDFYAYMPMHNYIFAPSREPWPAISVNARIPPVVVGKDDEGNEIIIKANVWLDRNQPVEQMIWAPGMPMIIANRLISEGGWIERKGVSCFNLYRPPTIELGDASKAGPWIELVHKVYPDDANRMIRWFAQRRQFPHIKINHSLFMGGVPGIGKDTILEPVKRATGPWNFKETAAKNILDDFNPWLRAVILRINEAKDMGDISRFDWYEATKTLMAAPPDVLPCNEKHIKQHYVLNCMGVVITSNHLTDGIYLPADDRRHDVTWSDRKQEDFTPEYWIRMWKWYDEGGDRHVAAYLATLDISDFDPKARPPKTPAFWRIVNANRTSEEGELQDALDKLGNPDAVTIEQIRNVTTDIGGQDSLWRWLGDRKNRKAVSHRLENCGYLAVNNPDPDDGLWRISGRRQVVYAKKVLPLGTQLQAAEALQRKAAEALQRRAAEEAEKKRGTPEEAFKDTFKK